jgi:oligosaccharyltransferase complex subunit alpha (ribophorin I)
MQDQVEVEIRPRFPLYGGWKTHYMLGYNVPSYQYLYNKYERNIFARMIDCFSL